MQYIFQLYQLYFIEQLSYIMLIQQKAAVAEWLRH